MSNPRVPQPLFPYRHVLDVQLRFNDADLFGHVNNSVYLQFFDLAKFDYFRTVTGEGFEIKDIALVVVNINCDFFAPSFIEEKLQVKTATIKIGDRSLVIEQRILSPETEEVKCVGRTVMAGFNLATNTSASIDANSRAHIETYEGREL